MRTLIVVACLALASLPGAANADPMLQQALASCKGMPECLALVRESPEAVEPWVACNMVAHGQRNDITLDGARRQCNAFFAEMRRMKRRLAKQ